MGKGDRKSASERSANRSLDRRTKQDLWSRAAVVLAEIDEMRAGIPSGDLESNTEYKRAKAELDGIEVKLKKPPSFLFTVRSKQRKLRRQGNQLGSGAEIAGRNAEGESFIQSRLDLMEEIKKYLGRDNVALAAQALVDLQLTATDLVTGSRQAEAIDAFFKDRPDIASFIHGLNPEEKAKTLSDLEANVGQAIIALESSRAGAENVEREVLMGAFEGKARDILGKAAENPGMTMFGIIAAVGGMLLVNHYKDKLGPLQGVVGALTTVGVAGGAVAGAVVGTHWLQKAVRDDGTGFLDGISLRDVSKKDKYDENHASSRFRRILESIPGVDRAAVDDLLRLGEVRCNVISEAFRDSLQDPAKSLTIDSRFFQGDARGINGVRARKALETIMGVCAGRSKVSSSSTDPTQRLHKGLSFFQSHYGANFKLSTSILHLIGTAEIPDSLDEVSTETILGFRSMLGRDPATPEEYKQAGKITAFFRKMHGLDMPVEARGIYGAGQSLIAIKGYLFIYSYDEVSKSHVFKDAAKIDSTFRIPIDGGGMINVETGKSGDVDMRTRTQANTLSSHIDTQMKGRLIARLTEGITDADDKATKIAELNELNLVFDTEGKQYWQFEPPYVATERTDLGAGKTSKAVPIIVYADEEYLKPGTNNDLVIYIDGIKDELNDDLQHFASFEAATAAYEKERLLPNIVRKSLEGYLGTFQFTVKKVHDDSYDEIAEPFKSKVSKGTVLEIVYGGSESGKYKETTGYIVYEGGSIILTHLPDNPELERAHREIASKRANLWRDKLEKSPGARSLSAAFEGHWKGKWWENLTTIPFGRTIEAIESLWLEDDDLGRGATHNRERWWQEMQGAFKLPEYQYSFQEQVYQILSTEASPTQAVKDIKKLENSLINTISGDFVDLSKEIHKDLKASHGDSDRGRVLEKTIRGAVEDLDKMGYKNNAYRDFSDSVEEMMNDAGYDWTGGDRWRRAKRVREAVRILAYEASWPIPILSDADIKPVHTGYLDDLFVKIEEAVKEAQLDDEGNVKLLKIEDRRISNVSFEDAFRASKFLTFRERNESVYEASVASAFITSAVAPVTPSGSGGTPEVLDNEEMHERIDKGKKALDKIYKEVDGPMFGKNGFEAFFNMFKRRKRKAFSTEVRLSAGTITDEGFDEILEDHKKKARAIEEDFADTTNDEIIATMVASMAPGTDWIGPSIFVAEMLKGEYGFDQFFVFNDYEALASIMDIWYDKLDAPVRSKKGSKATPKNYRNYFLTSLIEYMRTEGIGPGEDISPAKWNRIKANVSHGIDSYGTWSKKAITPVGLPSNLDNDKIAERGRELETERLVEEFDDWYKSELDVTEYFVFNSAWNDIFQRSVEQRFTDAKRQLTDPAHLENGIEVLKIALQEELALYDELHLRGIAPDDIGGGQEFLEEVILKTYKGSSTFGGIKIANLKAGRTSTATQTVLNDYGPALDKAMNDFIDPIAGIEADKELTKDFKGWLRLKRVEMIGIQDIPTNAHDALMWQGVFGHSARARLNEVLAGANSQTEKQVALENYKDYLDAEIAVIYKVLIARGTGQNVGFWAIGTNVRKLVEKVHKTFDDHIADKDPAAYRLALQDIALKQWW
jgi:hypothetical protein